MNRRSPRPIFLAALLLLASGVLTACGGNDVVSAERSVPVIAESDTALEPSDNATGASDDVANSADDAAAAVEPAVVDPATETDAATTTDSADDSTIEDPEGAEAPIEREDPIGDMARMFSFGDTPDLRSCISDQLTSVGLTAQTALAPELQGNEVTASMLRCGSRTDLEQLYGDPETLGATLGTDPNAASCGLDLFLDQIRQGTLEDTMAFLEADGPAPELEEAMVSECGLSKAQANTLMDG